MLVKPVVLAAGFGQLCPGKTKLVASVNGKPIICSVLEKLFDLKKKCKGVDNPLVVINPLFGPELKRVLSEFPVEYVEQPDRYGPADAVERAIATITNKEIEAILIIFGDMPFWKVETLEKVVSAYFSQKPTVVLVTLLLVERTPSVIKRYGRILRDDRGRILAIIEPEDEVDSFIPKVTSVNPSLYCWEIGWLKETLKKIKPRGKNDGHPDEKHLPPCVELAVREGKKIFEIPIDDFSQALGINNQKDLEIAKKI